MLPISMYLQNFIKIFDVANGIWQSFCIGLVNMNVYAKFYQNIPYAINGQFSLFHNLDLGKDATEGKWYFGLKIFYLNYRRTYMLTDI